MKQNKIIIISGPTATGKTDISIEVARKYDAEVINFDSLLFYKELNIGTAKPTQEEMGNVPHHMINTHSIKSPINAADYAKLATPIINDCHARGKVVVLSGGSGFYLQALINGMYDSITTPDEIIIKSNQLYTDEGIAPFIEELKVNDFTSYERYHENDHYRIRRAVEHFWTTGKPFSQAREGMEDKLKNSPTVKYGWELLNIYLDIPKPEHFEIIQKRTHKMIEAGLVEEVRNLLKTISNGTEKPIQSIGYKETIDFINGEFENLEEFKERISINTRKLAKSQRTWFKKQEKQQFNPITDKENIIKLCEGFILEKN